MMEDIEICHCNNIMECEIINELKVKGLKTVEEVKEATSAGTVCGECVPNIEDILNESINK